MPDDLFSDEALDPAQYLNDMTSAVEYDPYSGDEIPVVDLELPSAEGFIADKQAQEAAAFAAEHEAAMIADAEAVAPMAPEGNVISSFVEPDAVSGAAGPDWTPDFLPDAISGAPDVIDFGPEPEEVFLPGPEGEDYAAEYAAEYAPAPWDEQPMDVEFAPDAGPTPEDPGDYSNMALAQAMFDRQQEAATLRREMESKVNQDRIAAAQGELEIIEDTHRVFKKDTEDLIHRTRELGKKGVDKDRWWSSRSAGQKLALLFSAIGDGQLGLISGKGGNATFDLISKEIDRDIETQKYNLEQDRGLLQDEQGLVSQLYKETGSMASAVHGAKLTMLAGIEADINNQVAALDPEGTQALQKEAHKREMQAGMAAAATAFKQQRRKEAKETADLKIKTLKADAEIAEKEASAKLKLAQAAKASRRGTGGGGDVTHSPQAWQAHLRLPDGHPAIPTAPMSQKQYDKWAGHMQKAQGLAPSEKDEAATKTAEKRLGLVAAQTELTEAQTKGWPGGVIFGMGSPSGGVYKNKDGTPWTMDPKNPERKEVSALIKAAENARWVQDRIIIARNTYGGELAITRSKAYQELRSLQSGADMETFVGFNLGAPSAGDQELAGGIRGNTDAWSLVFDPNHGFKAWADRIEAKALVAARHNGYTGKTLELPRMRAATQSERKKAQVFADLEASVLPGEEVTDEVIENIRGDVEALTQKGLDPVEIQRVQGILDVVGRQAGIPRETIFELGEPLFVPHMTRRVGEAAEASGGKSGFKFDFFDLDLSPEEKWYKVRFER